MLIFDGQSPRSHGPRALRGISLVALLAGLAGLADHALAGATPENAVIVIDPAHADSMQIANFYINARNIPESNILYMDSAAATNYQQWAAVQGPAFQSFVNTHGISDHTDIVVVSPTDAYRISEGGLVGDSCSDVTQFSLGALYTMSFVSADVLAGTQDYNMPNRFYATSDGAVAFDSNTSYLSGNASSNVNARRYYIGTTLGYTGNRGNTPAQIISAITSSVAADGTRPAGKFYFMSNTADSARNIRSSQFTQAKNAITNRGGQAEIIVGTIPFGKTDCLGIMAGVANFSLASTGTVILPGAFCDHLTSYAATYDDGSQTKVSEWIAFNAGGSSGTIEEPCNYPGKFPRAMIHAHYFQGVTIAEAWFRNLQYVPFQQNFVGDPLARPFAYIPVVSVPDAPVGEVAGAVTLTPSATTASPTATIAGFDLLVNGVIRQSTVPGGHFTLDTLTLPDGYNDIRVIAIDSSAVKSGGRWVSTLLVNNRERTTTCSAQTSSGDRSTKFNFDVASTGGDILEIRLIQNGRVVAATHNTTATIGVHGQILGSGTCTLRAETEYKDGRLSRSEPVQVTVAASGPQLNPQPTAYSYRKKLTTKEPYVVELPATHDGPMSGPGYVYTILQGPSMATAQGTYTGAYRIYKPNPDAFGQEDITFRVTAPGGNSNVGTVTLIYTVCPADMDGSGFVDSDDYDYFVQLFEAGDTAADFDNSGFTDTDDFDAFVQAFEGGC